MPDRFTEILSQTFNVPMELIADDTHQKDVPSWDSLAMITMISALEAEYGIEFDLEEIVTFNSVKAVKDALVAKGVSV